MLREKMLAEDDRRRGASHPDTTFQLTNPGL
jgi:hypothetical protein